MKLNFKRALAAVAVTVFALSAPLAVLAGWGPERPSLTYNGPGTPGANHVVFNSFVNNPNYGDERTFLDGKLSSNTSAGGYLDQISAVPGQEYLLRVYVHNNADPSLNTDASQSGIARNTMVKITLPTATAQNLRVNGYISATNANPGTVSDTVDFTNSSQAVSLSYIPGSAKFHTNAVPAGFQLDDSIVTTGTKIGYTGPDGNLPGCFQYDGTATIKVKVNGQPVVTAEAPKLELTKQVKLNNADAWTTKITAKSGDTVQWLISYKNVGNAVAQNITLRDQLPPHLTLVPGSVKWYDVNNNGTQQGDTALFTSGGINVGNYGPQGGGYIRFQTRVKDDFQCGNTNINNNSFARADNITGEVTASAGVGVSKVCAASTTPTPTTPTPSSLPQTGAETGIGAMLGTGALGYAVTAYRRSKFALIDAVRGVHKR